MLTAAAAIVGCSNSPTSGGDHGPVPTGTILVGTPNGVERGAYLVDLATGGLEQIVSGISPFSIAFQGGYSAARNSVYGLSVADTQRIVELNLASRAVDTVLMVPDRAWTGAYDISADGRTLAIQTATLVVRLWTVDIGSGVWTQLVDHVGRIDTIPLASIRWSPDGKHLFVITEVFPDRSELVRVDLDTERFAVISPVTPITNATPSLDVSADAQLISHGDGDGNVIFRDADGVMVSGLPNIPGRVSRPRFSPDSRFLAYQEVLPLDHVIKIFMVRLSDGKRWELKMDADFEVWLVDWIPASRL